MTFIDFLLVAIFLVIVGLGFFQGTIKLLISLVGFYASIVLASLYFQFLAAFLARPAAPTPIENVVSFFIILFICFVILLIAGLYTFRYLRLPGRLDYLDRILGMLLGLGMGILAIGILAMLFNYGFVLHSPADTASFPLTGLIQGSVRSSRLRGVLINSILPAIYGIVAPFLPDSALIFFNPTLR